MSLFDRFMQMPRVMQWAIGAAVAILLFLVWDDNIRPMGEAWDRRAASIERQVARAREAADLERRITGRRDLIRQLGPVDVPAADEEGRESLHALIVDTVRRYRSVTNDSFNLSGGADRLPATVSALIFADTAQAGRRLVRISGDLRFDAEPEDAAAIIAALEARPEVESISLVRMLRKDGRTLGVTLTINAWVVQSSRPAAGR
jgi:hypothetical protein